MNISIEVGSSHNKMISEDDLEKMKICGEWRVVCPDWKKRI